MQTIATELYGIVGMFFTTNKRYEHPRLTYRDYRADSSEESSSSDSEDEASDADKPVANPAQLEAEAREKAERSADRAARNARRRKASEKARAKFREDDYIQRKRDLKSQKENERTLYPMMWRRMSPASQTRVREEERYH